MLNDETVMDALLVLLKAQRDDQFAEWNQQVVMEASAVIETRTEHAIQRIWQATRETSMTDAPIIRAARALVLKESGEDGYDALSEELQAQVVESVKAVLEAVREPSERMIEEGESAASIGLGKPTDDESVPRVWRMMLNAALSE